MKSADAPRRLQESRSAHPAHSSLAVDAALALGLEAGAIKTERYGA
jgi:hypothetical protein